MAPSFTAAAMPAALSRPHDAGYKDSAFSTFDRSETDAAGDPLPTLRMRLPGHPGA